MFTVWENMTVYGVIFVIIWVLTGAMQWSKSPLLRVSIIRGIGAVVTGVVLINTGSYVTSKLQQPSSISYTSIAASQVAQEYELMSKTTYPVSFGDFYSRAYYVDKASGYYAVFYDSKPSLESVAIQFTKGDQRLLFLLPTDKITFTQSTTEPQQLSLVVDTSKSQSSDGLYVATSYGGCQPVFEQLVVRCFREPLDQQVVIGQTAKVATLEQILTDHVTHAKMTLRPEQYKQLMG